MANERLRQGCRADQCLPLTCSYVNGESVEYGGKRDVGSMKLFAQKALAATQIRPLSNESELKRAAAADEVIVLFLHPQTGTSDENMVSRPLPRFVS